MLSEVLVVQQELLVMTPVQIVLLDLDSGLFSLLNPRKWWLLPAFQALLIEPLQF
jgi:hypothetical protein